MPSRALLLAVALALALLALLALVTLRAVTDRERPPARWPGAAAIPLADGFDFPVGAPDARGYRDAQPFGLNQHLGSDWNGVLGADTDLGDPVFAAAAGLVTEAADHGGGWGNVVRVVHRVSSAPGRAGAGAGPERVVETLYAHLDRIDVRPGDLVTRGQPIGTIGTAHGRYLAHLHFELRTSVGVALGGGYGDPAPLGHVDPTAFIQAHRPPRR